MGGRKEPMGTHNVVYMALLAAMGFFCCMGAVINWTIGRNPDLPSDSSWVFDIITYIYLMYLAAIVVTLVLRGVAPRVGRIATFSLNIVLLLLIPLGTALGIYGLWKVDKVRKQVESPG